MKDYIKKIVKPIVFLFISMKLVFLEFIYIISNNKNTKKKRLETKILVNIHSLEKGLGLKNTIIGYGKEKAKNVIKYINEYINRGYIVDSYVFYEAIKVLESYVCFNKENGVELKEIEEKLNDLKDYIKDEQKDEYNKYESGAKYISNKDILEATKFDFDKFVSLRHSIREFSEDIVDKEIIRKAVKIANKAPSACNRQPVKVYCTSNDKQSRDIDKLITGTSGFKENIHNFIIISCDRASFFEKEAFQWYINGGIYVSFLILALHSLGVGSCVMQWFPFYKTEKKLKKLLHMNKTEAIIAVIGLGYCKEENKCICAQRYNKEENLTFLEDKNVVK